VAYPETQHVTFERLVPEYAFRHAAMGDAKWLLFGRRTIADVYLYMLARTADLMPGSRAPYPSLAAFRARLGVGSGGIAALAEQSLQ
jgi:glutathione S-transferase